MAAQALPAPKVLTSDLGAEFLSCGFVCLLIPFSVYFEQKAESCIQPKFLIFFFFYSSA